MGATKTFEILQLAATHLEERGLAKGTTVNTWTGEVDIVGALQMAAGVPFHKIEEDIGVAVADLIPQAHLPGFLAAFEAVDGETEGVYEWQDLQTTTTESAVKLLKYLSGKYRRSPILDKYYYA